MEKKEPILVVKDLKQHFKINRNFTVKAVDGISFDIMPGETYGLVGESGSGKSTTGRSIIRLYKPTSGSIVFNGKEIGGKLDKATAKELHTKMQMIFQDPYASINPRMTVGDIIAEGMEIHKMYDADKRKKKVQELLELVGLNKEHANRFPHEFSGGQRQRLALARALLFDTPIYIFDEATSNIDMESEEMIMNVIRELSKTKMILFISHRLSNVVDSDCIYMMKDGIVAEEGTHEHLMRKKGAYQHLFDKQKELESYAANMSWNESLKKKVV
mgnify:CR=1 FL=1